VLESIIKHGQVVRGWIGIESQDITPELADSFGLGRDSGAIIAGVVRNGPADRAGMRPATSCCRSTASKSSHTNDMLNLIAQLRRAPRRTMKLMRKNRESTWLDVTVGKRPRPPRNFHLDHPCTCVT
jgi:serine protease DegQ